MSHRITQEVTKRIGYELTLKNGNLMRTHDWFIDSKQHRFECECGKKFNKEEKAIKHIQENQE